MKCNFISTQNFLKLKLLVFALLMLFCLDEVIGQAQKVDMEQQAKVVLEWPKLNSEASFSVSCGTISYIQVLKGKGRVEGETFYPRSKSSIRLEITYNLECGDSERAIVSVKTEENPFSFFASDVHGGAPIFAPELGVVVLDGGDDRSYLEIAENIGQRDLKTNIKRWETEEEETYDSAASKTMVQLTPTLLGVSRDFRIFNLDERTTGNATYTVSPTLSSSPMAFPDLKMNNVAYAFAFGRGLGVMPNTKRGLLEGIYPIRKTWMKDGGVDYEATAFVSYEATELTEENIRGTDYLVATKYSSGSMLTDAQQTEFDGKVDGELNQSEETVFYYKVVATNNDKVPNYAWFKTAKPGTAWWVSFPYQYESGSGFSIYPNDKVFAVSKMNGKPLAKEETAILLQPGETATFEFYLPHAPISRERANKLVDVNFEAKKEECLSFWESKLSKASHIEVPDERINRLIKAGLIHLDLITYGLEPDGTLAPAIGKYSPIGTESSPIIQFYASMGWTDVAKRSVNFFLDKQRKDGFIQNFNGYMVETGAALYTMGEYYRYSKDIDWLKSKKEAILKSANYLIKWRNENKIEALKKEGYGMIAGKVADPEDHFHQYMLNGYGYLGLKRIAEIIKDVDVDLAKTLEQEAISWRADIRESFFHSLAMSPLVPLKDGTWVPSSPAWTGGIGFRALNVQNQNFWSHGTFTTADALLGPLYLVFCEVLEPDEEVADWLLDYHTDILFQENTAFSQPYYSRHDWIQAKKGMVKPYLKTYFNSLLGLVDRETLTFWEHVFGASHHKTHEEAWFLMQTRWMLYMEKDGETLELLKLIPRSWMGNGKKIVLDGVRSYFGTLDVTAESSIADGSIKASVNGEFTHTPRTVTIRLPHPEHKLPKKVEGGVFNPENETVTIKNFSGSSLIKLSY